jgi:hypothetical protein
MLKAPSRCFQHPPPKIDRFLLGDFNKPGVTVDRTNSRTPV